MFAATMLPTSTLGSGSGSVDMAWDGAAAGTAARATVRCQIPALQTAAPHTAAPHTPLHPLRRNVASGGDIARTPERRGSVGRDGRSRRERGRAGCSDDRKIAL